MGAIRKVSLAVVAAALVLALGATPAFARGNGSAQRGTQRQLRSSTAARYVDTDGGGVCDNYGTYGHHGGTGNGSGNGYRSGRF